MPNYDGTIWQNPTVMETIAPVISEVTGRMEASIKDKAKQDALLAAKAQDLEYKKAKDGIKAKNDAIKNQATLPDAVPTVMHDYDTPLLNEWQTDFYSRLGAAAKGDANVKIGHTDPVSIALTNEWNDFMQKKAEAGTRFKAYHQLWEAGTKLDKNEYERNPEEYLSEQYQSEEALAKNLKAQGLTPREIYKQFKGGTYGLPNKKAPELSIKDGDLPSFIIENRKEAATDKFGNAITKVSPTERMDLFAQDLELAYNSQAKPTLVNYINKYHKKPDGTIDFNAAATQLKGIAPKENRAYGDDKERRG